jgi:guanidinopropionase
VGVWCGQPWAVSTLAASGLVLLLRFAIGAWDMLIGIAATVRCMVGSLSCGQPPASCGVTSIMHNDLCQVADVGDVPQNPLDLADSIQKIQAFFATLHAAGVVPVTAGGDHTITLPILRALATEGPVGCIHFDAHADTLDTLLGTKINHGTPFRRAVEEGLIDPRRMIQIGLRGTRYSDEDIAFGADVGMRLITMDDYEEMGRAHVITEARRVVGEGPTYITFDIDGLDPIYAIGTGAPEPGGLSMRDAQVMLRGLRGLQLIGGDVCEVSPPLDPTGHTALNAANLMFEILCVVADAVAQRRT